MTPGIRLRTRTKYRHPPPTYQQSGIAPRCPQDISDPAPSYEVALTAPIPSVADKLVAWVAVETYRRLTRYNRPQVPREIWQRCG